MFQQGHVQELCVMKLCSKMCLDGNTRVWS